MASPVTVDDFTTRFPQFADTDDEQIQALLDEASRSVDDSWTADDIKPAILYLTAHMLLSETAESDKGGSFGIASESIGPISQSYVNQAGQAAADPLLGSEYGRRYLALLKKNKSGPLVV
jgi:hypothetical protein